MTGSTVPDGFEFETDNDAPAVTLRTEAGETLAEKLQAKFVATDATIASLTSRVTALEDGTGGAGWIPIGTGNDSGSGFSIDLTAGGKFPDPPLWNLVQVHMRVDLDTVGQVRMSINGDNDPVYRSGSFMMDSTIPGNSDDDNWHRGPTASSWSLAQLSTVSTGNLSLTLFHTAANPGLLNFQCVSARQSNDPSAHRNQISSGSLTTAKTASSLTFGASPGSFNSAWWWATGLRMTAP